MDLAEILNIGGKLSRLSQIITPGFAKYNGLTFVSKLRQKCENENFVEELVSAAYEYFGGPECDVFMMILNLLVPGISELLKDYTNIPLTKFKTPEEVYVFLTALIETGVTSQMERSIVFVMGNTGHSGTTK